MASHIGLEPVQMIHGANIKLHNVAQHCIFFLLNCFWSFQLSN